MINKEEQSHQMISALFSLSTAYFVFRIHTGLKMEEIFLRFFSNQPFNQLPIIGQMHHHCGFCPYGIMLCNGFSNSPVRAYGFIGKLLMGYITNIRTAVSIMGTSCFTTTLREHSATQE